MAKKVVVDNSQVPSNTISGAGQGANSATVAFDMMPESNLFYSTRTKSGRRGKEIDDELLSDEGAVVDTEQVVSDRVYADLEYEILLAQVDAVPLPYTIYNTDTVSTASINASNDVAQNSTGTISGGAAIWWWGGAGVAAVAAGVGLSSSGGGGSAKGGTVNTAPIITSGATGTVNENAPISTIVYDAHATDADAGTTLTYSLKPATGDVAALDINASTGEVTLKVPADFESKSSYSFTVIASDGTNSSEQAVIVTVTNVNEPPTIISGSTGSVAENAAISTVIYDAAANDADAGTTITYSLKPATGDVAALDINAITGEVSLKVPADFETKPSYSFTVVASDGTNSSEQAVTVNVTDVNEAPVITSNGGVSVVEGRATVTIVTATDVDAGDSQTYSISGGLDAEKFAINPTTGALTFITAPDFEIPADNGGNNVYEVQVKVTDNDTLFDVQDIAITITDVSPEPPIFSSGGIVSVDENVLVGTIVYDANTDFEGSVVYSLIGSDADQFNIDATSGAVAINSSTNFETKATYNFTVVADNGGAISEQPVILTVTDINEAPVITSNAGGDNASIDVVENQIAITTVTAFDPDLGASKTYTLTGGSDVGLFSINQATGVLTFNSAPDYEVPVDTDFNNAYDVQVTVSDGTLTDVQNITVNVTDYNEAPPVFTAPSDIYVSEGTAVFSVSATDADTFQTRIYSLGGPDVGKFTINQSNGEVTFNTTPNYEKPENVDNTYNLTVTATDNGTDPGALFTTQNFTVHVTDAVENVVVEEGGAFLDFNANGVKDAEDNVRADFQDPAAPGYINLANQITVHFNAAPIDPLNLSGFGSDDLIEIDAQAFIANGHHVLNILALQNIKTLDAFSTYTLGSPGSNPTSMVYNSYTTINSGAGTSYVNSNSYSGVLGPLNAKIGLRLQDQNTATRTLLFFSTSQSATQLPWVLASGLPTDMPLQDVVDFVNLPVQSAIVHVVVDSNGAVIDIDGDGVRDIGENRLANFDTDGNADLAGKSVVIHFNDAPSNALNLAGFGTDDLIEIDAQAFYANGYQDAALFGHPDAKTLDQYQAYSEFRTSTSDGFIQGFSSINSNTEFYYLWNSMQGSGFQLSYAKNSSALFLASYTRWGITLATSLPQVLSPSGWSPLQDMVNFVNLPQDLQIVVDQRGAFFDTNANGIVDGDERSNPADFDPISGNVFVGYNHVTVHYNDVPNGDININLSGFGADDLIEIDVQAFIDNGHNALQILNQPNIVTLDQFTPPNTTTPGRTASYSNTYNWLYSAASANYGNSHRQDIVTTSGSVSNTWIRANLYLNSWSQRLSFSSYNGSTNSVGQLASGLPTDLPLWQMVDYVNVPLPPDPLDPVYVVVEQNGAVIDFDGDGVRDNGENWLADFGAGGNADLAAKNSVVIHFNDIPMSALNLTGFGTEDKIEIDTGDSWLANFGVGASSVNYQLAHYTGPATIANTTIRVNQILNLITVTGSSSGTLAYWTDTGNALNDPANLLTNFNGTNNTKVLVDLNANHYPGLVEFVWPVNVVVESEGAFIDANANGVYENGEVAVDSFQTGGNADLAANNVLIHFNDLPDTPLNLAGFDGNDRIEIDLVAMKFGDDSVIRNSQGSWTFSSSTQFYEGASGVQIFAFSSTAAVYIEGSTLKTGHLTSITSRTVGGTNWYQKFTATGPNEGTLAINVGPLYNHYQQVAYVVDGGGPI